MIRISLSGLALIIGMMSGFAQRRIVIDRSDDQKTGQQSNPNDNYKARALKLDEINFVSGYYSQNGNHSAVTGGIGTEKLSDLSNTFELKLLKNTRSGITHHFGFMMGFDTYTSASSDKIDTATVYHNTTVVTTPTPVPGRHGRSGASNAVASGPTIVVNGKTTVTSASYRDQRYYPSLSYSIENPNNGLMIGAGVS